jgi:hypothetical protein
LRQRYPVDQAFVITRERIVIPLSSQNLTSDPDPDLIRDALSCQEATHVVERVSRERRRMHRLGQNSPKRSGACHFPSDG